VSAKRNGWHSAWRRSGRSISTIGGMGPPLAPEEQRDADTALAPLGGRDFIVSIGTKWQADDRDDTDWAALLRSLSAE
jgi:hypothetical protein